MTLLNRRVKPTTIKDRVAEIVEEAIFAGEINPGDKVNELRLAKQLGVGTTSVREALFDLERRGFIRRMANKGSFVTQFSQEDIGQIYDVRCELEGLAAELVVRNQIAKQDLKRLQHFIEEMKAAAREGDLPRFYESDLEFHESLWALSQNRFISQLLESITVPLFAFYVMKTKRNSEELLTGAAAHQGIVDAIEKGNPVNARKVVEKSIRFFFEHGRTLRK